MPYGVRVYGVQKFNFDAILFGENKCKKNGILKFKRCFRLAFGWDQVKYICKNNDHTCLFHCIDTCRVPPEMFEHSA